MSFPLIPMPVPETGTFKIFDTLVNATLVRVVRRCCLWRFERGSDMTAVIWILPLALPPEAGVKVTPIGVVCPAFRVSGKFTPLRANPRPEISAPVMLMSRLPELDNVVDCV